MEKKIMTTFIAYQLAIQFCKLTRSKKLPMGLGNQFGRASSSVALNLAEGWGRFTRKDRVHFFQMALGSIRECQAIADIQSEMFTTDERDKLDHLAAATYKLIRHQRG